MQQLNLTTCKHPNCEYPHFLREQEYMWVDRKIKPVPYCKECRILNSLFVALVPERILKQVGIK